MKRINVLACTGGGGSSFSRNSKLEPSVWTTNLAFTMAEILLSLTIIGVVAAITLPSLTGNINERTWNTQRKAIYARFSQAIALMPSLNGYGTYVEATSSSSAVDNVAETFVTSGLSKVLKINNICDSEHLEDCGIPEKIITGTANGSLNLQDIKTIRGFNGMFGGTYTYYGSTYSAISFSDIKAAAFETANGESVLVYYNPNCTANMSEGSFYLQRKLCANFVFDLNGSKGPNTFGKDIGMISAFYPSDSVVVSPFPVARGVTSGLAQTSLVEGQRSCRQNFDNARVPNREELMSMAANAYLFGRDDLSVGVQSSSIVDSETNWHVSFVTGSVYQRASSNGAIWCINR